MFVCMCACMKMCVPHAYIEIKKRMSSVTVYQYLQYSHKTESVTEPAARMS